MKKFLLTLTVVLGMFVSCGSNNETNQNSEVIRVGVPEPLTGEVAQYGQSIKEGIELHIDEINKNGGINGKKLLPEYVDTKGDVQEAVNIFKQMYTNGVDVILGEATSANTLAIAEYAQKASVPFITPAATAVDVTKDKDYIFRVTFTDAYQGEILAKYLKKQGIDKTALMTNISSDYSLGLADAFKKQAKLEGIEIYEVKYTKEDKDFKSILTDIKNKGYKTVVLPEYYNIVGLILSQAKEVSFDGQFYGGDGWDGIQENFAKVAEGSVFSTQFASNIEDSKIQEFVKNYEDKFKKTPTIFAALGYDAVSVLEEALKKNTDLKTALKETDMDLITGHITFDENRNPRKEVLFVEVKDGKVQLKEKFGE